MIQMIWFWALGLLAVAAGFGVFRAKSMVRVSFLLLTSFLAVAGELLLLASEFLGAIIVLMMTGEMVIMAVFMVMYMMNPGGLMPMAMYHNKPFALTVSIGSFGALATGALLVDWPERRGTVPNDVTFAIGEAMMGPKMLVFLAAGVAMLACMVASLSLATPRGRYDRYGDELDAERPNDPVPGGVGR